MVFNFEGLQPENSILLALRKLYKHVSQQLLLGILFGFLNHGGLIPSLLKLNTDLHQIQGCHGASVEDWNWHNCQDRQTTSTWFDGVEPNVESADSASPAQVRLVYWQTLMPPRRLVLPPRECTSPEAFKYFELVAKC